MGAPVVLAAKVWHYWVALPLVAVGVIALIATFVSYLVKVVAARYPRQ